MTPTTIALAALGLVALADLVLLLRLLRGAARPAADAARLEQALRSELRAAREEAAAQARAVREEAAAASRGLREELLLALKSTGDSQVATLGQMGGLQRAQLQEVAARVDALTAATTQALEATRGTTESQLRASAESMQARLDGIRDTVDRNLQQLQQKNEAKLEEMRKTVDEQLHGTLEKRLGESFQIVSGRLEAVHRGLGEMQALAQGVGDLRRVLTNVKARGTWAEVQLGAILEQILTPDQYGRNVRVKDDSEERVEFAVRLPGRGATSPGAADGGVWLPIDSKFPQESYIRLLQASEAGDAEAVQGALAELTKVVRLCARTIFEKYVAPPQTTDFAVLFLPTEGLYAEVLRQPGFVEQLQDTYRVVVAGPTTLAALLSSLRMGFRTLAIEQRASEVWTVLGAVKSEFGKFGDVLEKIKRQLATASRSLTETGVRTRAMARKLRDVEELPAAQAEKVLQLGDGYVQMELIAGEAEGDGEEDGESELEGEGEAAGADLLAPVPDSTA